MSFLIKMAAVKFFSLGCVGLLRRNVNVGNKLPQGSVGREIFVTNYDIFLTMLTRSRQIRGRDLTFFCVSDLKNTHSEKLNFPFFTRIVKRLFSLKEEEPPSDCRMIKRLTFDNLFPSLQHFR